MVVLMIDRHCHNIYTVRQIMRLFDTIAKSKVKINMIQRIHDEKVTLYQDFSLKGMINKYMQNSDHSIT